MLRLDHSQEVLNGIHGKPSVERRVVERDGIETLSGGEDGSSGDLVPVCDEPEQKGS